MRTTSEMIAFMKNANMSSIEAPKHVPLIEQALMPSENVIFCFCGNQNSTGAKSQGMHVYALTDQRFMVAQGNSFTSTRNTRMTESYQYEQIGNISYSKGLLTGSITISFYNGVGSIAVEKKAVEYIYNSLNKALHDVRNNHVTTNEVTTEASNNKFCVTCGTKLPNSSAFCSSCGSAQ